VATIYGKNYCEKCRDGIDAARGSVDGHVDPKDCFIWYKANDDWEPIDGTGCAHWVSHQLDVKEGSAGDRCLTGFTYRVRTLVRLRTPVKDISDVKVNDIWASASLDHTGLVVDVTGADKPGDPPSITIRHDSSRQGRVADNDFASYFHSRGDFYR
jgi:hypothetical protein